jgi:hypothetical protein
MGFAVGGWAATAFFVLAAFIQIARRASRALVLLRRGEAYRHALLRSLNR